MRRGPRERIEQRIQEHLKRGRADLRGEALQEALQEVLQKEAVRTPYAKEFIGLCLDDLASTRR